MAVEFNGKRNVNNFKIGNEVPSKKDVQNEEKVQEQKQTFDNKFVKDLGEELLTSTAASAYGINFTKPAGTKIDKAFWGDALRGLNVKDTAVSADTVSGIADIDNTFAIIDMENKMASSPFMKALNEEFGI